MGMFTKISSEAFESLQFDAGMILNTFNPASAAAPADSAIVTATSGGITATCTPSFVDLGEDVDNCPNGMMEMMRIDGYECTLSFTALNMTPESIKLALGAADISSNKITPRATLSEDDFADIWWVGDRTDGGWAAVNLKNALSTGGLSIKTTKKGKGQLEVTLKGHFSIDAQSTVPMEFYVTEATD